jgi:hypothetical protein
MSGLSSGGIFLPLHFLTRGAYKLGDRISPLQGKHMPLLISSFKDTIKDEYISLGAFVRVRKFVVMKTDVLKQEKNIISQTNLQGKWWTGKKYEAIHNLYSALHIVYHRICELL